MGRRKRKSRGDAFKHKVLLSKWPDAVGKKSDPLWNTKNSKPGPVIIINPDEYNQNK